ncbi:hypothetical protein MVES1_000142 [Malassezia vespertilionis]|uniref:Rpc53p n=1 Tax=Malassezia vespertilionis TaxID=2020962 RepID=A0A2N1JHM7_9BASI|nr:uncharacterized protein MVES1_000142 [Malassezia vespertilionis]PKI86028.1 hypothetical protein MVES_000142 [Malassezia vespertilionis]WFD04818.1 hypothetical protein MVES1_000142 [Malassezia vespertilionis]
MEQQQEGAAQRDSNTQPLGRVRRGALQQPGRTTSMVPTRLGAGANGIANAQASSPGSQRMVFRPVIPQRRRTPSDALQPSAQDIFESDASMAPVPLPAVRPKLRGPIEMTATGPFALGPTEKPLARSTRTQNMPATVHMGLDAAHAPLGTAEDPVTIDIQDVQGLDDAAPQTLLRPPRRLKREAEHIKQETATKDVDMRDTPLDTQDVNAAQALDLSESEGEEGEEELASRFVSSIRTGQSDGHLFLFQFPSTFPSFSTLPPTVETKPEVEEAPNSDDDVIEIAEHASTAAAQPAPQAPSAEGQIGRLDMYRDGRVVLHLGGIPFDVVGGSDPSFLQQIMLLDGQQQRAMCLGELDAKLVAVPDMQYLLSQPAAHAPI